ncbi:ADP-heptose--LPS heptosyltransferase I [Paraphotobacterium marinum]|uniref:ADP-heptose--LPS heptosyltransferase I n=1 Tax=Paraphotobacterium marinum TaxID=1755811 RepID=A0A220VCU8_9GAMM|nr:glycosyltransferase family 9 protein [Paraphotobacterium marinum]ASK78056.1 ADP-heptose--LPS heptosyltransferase I [Paraphotobacterium marinum]
MKKCLPLFKKPPKNICILRLSAIGDVSNTVPLISAIQTQWPSTKITWVVGQIEYNLIKNIPKVKFITFNKKNGIKEYLKLRKELKNEKFDALLNLQSSMRANLISLFIKSKYKLGYSKNRSRELQHFFTNVKVQPAQSVHVLDNFMSFGKCLGVSEEKISWNIPINQVSLENLKKKIPNQPICILIPSASNPQRNWTIDGYLKLIEYLNKLGFHIILAGSPASREVVFANKIAENCSCEVLNFVGKTSLEDLYALISIANLVVAPDTGPAHLAASLNIPTVGLYAYQNPQRTGPYNFIQYTVNAYDEALKKERDSVQKNWRYRIKNEKAMELIKIKDVKEKIEQIIFDKNIQIN